MPDWKCSVCGSSEKKKRAKGLCRQCYVKARVARLYAEDPQWRAKESKARYYANKEPFLIRARERNRRLKWEVVTALGGKCACCGESEPEFLTVDHINGDGAAHRKKVTGTTRASSIMVYKDIKRQGFPRTVYRVLCFNCNCAIGCWGYCPHAPSPLRTSPPTFVGTSR